MLSKRRIKGESKQNQSALRHKVRNLRAKVRLLLPMELCCKQQKRSKNLLKMSYNRAIQQQQKQKRWCHCRENSQQLYIPHETGRSEKHLFHKLTNEEIEQIKEDKMYYLGEQFIAEFDNFLENRNKVSTNKSTKMLESRIITQNPVRSIQQFEEKNWNWHKASSSELFSSNHKQNKMNWHIRQVIKFQGMRQKRKIITEQDMTRRVYVKMKLKQKQQKMRVNHQKMMQTKIKSIKQRNKLEDLKSTYSIRTKHNMRQYGEITDLSQKLREVCLLRASKSANLLFRS